MTPAIERGRLNYLGAAVTVTRWKERISWQRIP
jgi:hypothetical protein